MCTLYQERFPDVRLEQGRQPDVRRVHHRHVGQRLESGGKTLLVSIHLINLLSSSLKVPHSRVGSWPSP